MQFDGSHSTLTPTVHRDIALSINIQYTGKSNIQLIVIYKAQKVEGIYHTMSG